MAGSHNVQVISLGGDQSCLGRLHKLAAVILVFSFRICLISSFILTTALAGTETGEFCPTCPDWTNLDGWLAKKEAYERAQQNGDQTGGQTNGNAIATTAKVDPPTKSYAVPELLTSANQLKNDQVILDIRTKQDYRAGHLAGARNLYWKDLQNDGHLDSTKAREALGHVGVNDTDRLLIYGDTSEGAVFAFWALCYLGQKNASLLDGGVEAARNSGIELTKNAPSPQPSNYTPPAANWLSVTPDNLEDFLGLADVQILDARDFSDYGRGRLTNASISIPMEKLYQNYGIKDAATLEELLDRRGLGDKGIQIVYGTPQAYWLFYSLKLMGYNATLLEGDWWKETKWAVSNVR